MKKYCLLWFLVLLFSCSLFQEEDPHAIELYVSLGAYSTLPGGEYSDLLNYGNAHVNFSVRGVDTGINDSINLSAGQVDFSLTGNNAQNYTQYAVYRFLLEDSSGFYPGGNFKFRIFIDWDKSGTFNSGDLYMTGYSIIGDTDNDSGTPGESVPQENWGSSIIYDGGDYSVVIDDPLTYGRGFQWRVLQVHEGVLAVEP